MKQRTEFPLPTPAGPRFDPRGAHVVMRHKGRELLGEVRGYARAPGGWWELEVRFFDGSPWPVRPNIGAVEVLVRTYDSE